MTLQVEVGDIDLGHRFYAALFGRDPDFEPHRSFLEWQVLEGVELWWQVVGVTGGVAPIATRTRFLVDDVRAAADGVRRRLGVEPSPVTTLPGVVSFTDFEDPWGNRIGYYEDIVPSGQQPEPGGSVHDEAMYEADA